MQYVTHAPLAELYAYQTGKDTETKARLAECIS